MTIKIKKQKGCCIFNFNCDEISKEGIEALDLHVEKYSKSSKIALNLEKIERVHESFFEFIKNHNFSLLGANSNILTCFSLRKIINLIPIYLSTNDFIKNKRRIIKRDFKVV